MSFFTLDQKDITIDNLVVFFFSDDLRKLKKGNGYLLCSPVESRTINCGVYDLLILVLCFLRI